MNIEELAFKDSKNLAQLNENDLLDIIEFLQNDRKQWINQFTQTHNESIDIQKENQELKLELSGYRQAILEDKDMLGLKEENTELKKQLEELKEEKQEWINLLAMFKNQQKEFIKYLENEIKIYSNTYMGEMLKELKEILQKYRSIIGCDKVE